MLSHKALVRAAVATVVVATAVVATAAAVTVVAVMLLSASGNGPNTNRPGPTADMLLLRTMLRRRAACRAGISMECAVQGQVQSLQGEELSAETLEIGQRIEGNVAFANAGESLLK
jgi:hypothetical protein